MLATRKLLKAGVDLDLSRFLLVEEKSDCLVCLSIGLALSERS